MLRLVVSCRYYIHMLLSYSDSSLLKANIVHNTILFYSDSPVSTATTVAELFKDSLRRYHLPPIMLFFWAYLHQYHCHNILGRLRTGKAKSQYCIPNGDWFEFVSSPHYLAEMLIYLALSLCLAVHHPLTPMWLVFLSTCCTLSASAKQTHQWYKKFEDYPTNRKIVIPYVY